MKRLIAIVTAIFLSTVFSAAIASVQGFKQGTDESISKTASVQQSNPQSAMLLAKNDKPKEAE